LSLPAEPRQDCSISPVDLLARIAILTYKVLEGYKDGQPDAERGAHIERREDC
jgi:hypothetical protein